MLSGKMTPTGKRKPRLFYSSPPRYVQFVVGTNEHVFQVQIGLLARYCDEFQIAMTSGVKFKEQILLPDIGADVFRIFLRWLYAQNTPGTALDIFWPYGEQQWEGMSWVDNYLVKLYIFAWDYGIPRFCRALLDVFYSRYIPTHQIPSFGTILMAFDHLPSSSPLCLLLIDIQCKRWVAKDSEDEKGLIQELDWKKYVSIAEVNEPLKACYYHDHTNEDAKRSCKIRCGMSDIKNVGERSLGVDIVKRLTSQIPNFSMPNRGVDIPVVFFDGLGSRVLF